MTNSSRFSMDCRSFQPVKDSVDLRRRVTRFFEKWRRGINANGEMSMVQPRRGLDSAAQITLFDSTAPGAQCIETPATSLTEFLNLIAGSLPDGDIYLFGGVLRDLALFGSRGFNSDIDLVAEGDWASIVPRMERLGATGNKFGGLRFNFGGLPIDIWQARETWAIKRGYVEYENILSLLDSTVLNWDSILMSWRTKSLFHRPRYFEELNSRYMDIVLIDNPNPLGMLVRILRHLLLKDAQGMSSSVIRYLRRAVSDHDYHTIRSAESRSYGTIVIRRDVYALLERMVASEELTSLEPARILEEIKNPVRRMF